MTTLSRVKPETARASDRSARRQRRRPKNCESAHPGIPRMASKKNWSIVRKVIGYDRYEGPEALAQLNHVYEVLRLWTNHWQPVMKLSGKERVGAKLRKHCDLARTPYQRLRHSRDLTLPRRHRLEAEHARLAPLALKQQLDTAVMQLERLRSRPALKPPASVATAAS
jgi:hypothetical protein